MTDQSGSSSTYLVPTGDTVVTTAGEIRPITVPLRIDRARSIAGRVFPLSAARQARRLHHTTVLFAFTGD